MITLSSSDSIQAVAGSATSVTSTISGDELTIATGVDTFKVLDQRQLPSSVASLYAPASGKSALIKQWLLANTTAGSITVTLYMNGTAAANQISSLPIPANGEAVLADDGWKVFDGNGAFVTTTPITLTGDVAGSGVGSIVTTIANNAVTNAKLNDMATATFKGRTTAGTGDPEDLTVTQATALLNVATTSLKGLQSSTDKLKEDNLWYDVTANSIATLVGDGTTDNAALWTTLFAGLPTGATVYFPAGTYATTAEFAISADKHLRIIGAGRYATTIKTITSTTANIFHINGQYWYNSFENLGFASTPTKTAGAAIFIDPGASGAAIATNIKNCAFTGQFIAINAQGAQAANASYWDGLDISSAPVNGRGILINGSTINLGITNSLINLGYPPFQVTGTACIEIQQAGAVQMLNLEVIGGINTLLLNANQGGSTSVAAVFATNCFFDQSGGSTVKITGANIVNRVKFVQCGITGGNVAGATAVEIASTGTGAAGTATAAADGIDFFDCDIYPNSGSGTIQGFLITGAQGVAINSCRVSGWTNGVQITPVASNGYTKLFMAENKMGATNNFTTANTVGVLLNVGSFQFGSVIVSGNDFSGSTTPFTDNSTVTAAAQKAFENNVGVVNSGGVGTLPTAAQSLTASSANLLNGSSVALTTGQLHIGSRFRFIVGLIKTAAGAATWQAIVKFGVNNTTADAAIATWTSGTNTGAIDQAVLTIEVEVTAIGASATAKCIAMYANTLTNATGLGVINFIPGSTATFNANATTPFLHVDVTPGTLAVMTAVSSAECLTS